MNSNAALFCNPESGYGSPTQGFPVTTEQLSQYYAKKELRIPKQRLKVTLQQFGYHPVIGTVGLWKHTTRPIQFCLCVDDFGVKYYNKKDVVQLLQAIGKLYKLL